MNTPREILDFNSNIEAGEGIIITGKGDLYDPLKITLDGDIPVLPTGTENEILSFDENGELISSNINDITSQNPLKIGTPLVNEDAVNLGYLNTRIPDSGTNGQVLKKDASGNNIWSTDANTTYTVITDTEFNAGVATTARAVSAVSLKRDIDATITLRLPLPPVSGTATLQSVEGVVNWVITP